MLKIEDGTKKSLFTLLAIIIFGIFLSLSYWMFQSEFTGILTDVLEGVKSGSLEKIGAAFDSDKTLGPYGDPTILPTPASDFEFDPETGTLIKYKGISNKIVVPAEIDGVTVEIIGQAFSEKSNHVFNEIILPNTIKTLDYASFIRSNLVHINLPNSVETIGEASFGYSSYLQSITIGNNLKEIADYAFMFTEFKNLKLPNSSFTIGKNAFMYTKLNSVDLGGATAIDTYAFMNSQINNLTIPNTVKTIGSGALMNTTNLNSIKIGNGISFVPSSLLQGSSVEEVIFESGGEDKTFGSAIFINATKLTKLDLPQNTKSFGGNGILVNSGLKEFTYPGYMKEINDANATNMGGAKIEVLKFGEGITKITETFSGLNGILRTVTLPDSLVTLGNSTFAGNHALTDINFGSNLESIGNSSFVSNSLTELNLPNSLKTIGDNAFISNDLTTLVLPNSVTSIGRQSFTSNKLTSVTLSTKMTEIPETAFADNNLTSIHIPNNITKIGDSAFAGNQITSVVIPDSVTSLGYYAFSSDALKTAELPHSFIGKDLTDIFPETTVITYR